MANRHGYSINTSRERCQVSRSKVYQRIGVLHVGCDFYSSQLTHIKRQSMLPTNLSEMYHAVKQTKDHIEQCNVILMSEEKSLDKVLEQILEEVFKAR